MKIFKSTPKSRARKRDNAVLIGEAQVAVTEWLDSSAGQLSLLAAAGVGGLLVGLVEKAF